MRLVSLVGLVALAGWAQGHVVDNEKRQSSCVAITGTSGTVYPRLEVRQMLNTKPNQWTLFMLALRQMMDKSQTDPLSYYSIAGIHGVPRQNWDNVGQCSSCGDADGYCPHDSALFPAWHRAYIALFEQTFLSIVNSIANSYPSSSRAAMTGAASTMRFPYWDWAAQPAPNLPTFPNVVQSKTVTVNGPSGSQTFTNPLFRFDFKDPSQLYYSTFTSWKVTYRYPNNNSTTAVSSNPSAANAFTNARPGLQDQVYQLFSTCKDYLHFSNDNSNPGSTTCSNSLEGIHNTIHTTAGGPAPNQWTPAGHMTYLATSAFDPIFWLHHTNVDRLFAMWQAINPNSYSFSQVAPHDTWTVAAGSTQDTNSPLTPFHKDTSCNFWTTNTVKNTNTFGYTYPEFSNSDGSASAINSYINKLYGPSATATAGSSKRTAAPAEAQEEKRGFEKRGLFPPSLFKADNGSTYEYVANIVTPRYALDDSYSIYMFLGEPTSDDPSQWPTDRNMIGVYGVIAQEGMKNANILITGSIPLTRALTDRLGQGVMATLSQLHVGPFLTKFLHWKIVCKGEVIDPLLLPAFKVSVYATTATEPTSPFELPVFGVFNPMTNVTSNKPGGLKLPSLAPSSSKTTVTSVVKSTTTICTATSPACATSA